jgi:hypothetical protein
MHHMHRFTIIAPHVRNDGSMAPYVSNLRQALLLAGIEGWTEYETHGSWKGVREAGTTFEVLRERPGYLRDIDWAVEWLEFLGNVARTAMGTGQDAIQITYEGRVLVHEA